MISAVRFILHIFRRIRRAPPAGRRRIIIGIAATTAAAQAQRRPVAWRRGVSR